MYTMMCIYICTYCIYHLDLGQANQMSREDVQKWFDFTYYWDPTTRKTPSEDQLSRGDIPWKFVKVFHEIPQRFQRSNEKLLNINLPGGLRQVRLGALNPLKLISGVELHDTTTALGLTSYTIEAGQWQLAGGFRRRRSWKTWTFNWGKF